MTVMVATLSQLLGLEQRVDEVDHQPHGDEAGERIVEDHASLLRDGRRRRRSRPTARRRLGRWPAWRCPTLDAPGKAPLSTERLLASAALRRVKNVRTHLRSGPTICRQSHRNSRATQGVKL